MPALCNGLAIRGAIAYIGCIANARGDRTDMDTLHTVKPNEGLIIRVGARGTQYARVLSIAPHGKTARVQKWLARGKRWTLPLTLYAVDAIRPATADETRLADRRERGL